MFKDYDKYLSTSLKVYLFVLIIIFILKLVGLDYFGLDTNNLILIKINNFCMKFHLVDVWYCITLYLYAYIIISISSNNKKIHKIILIFMPISIIEKTLFANLPLIRFICDFAILFLMNVFAKGSIKRLITVLFLNTFYQIISLLIRNENIIINNNDFIQALIFNFDYILMSIITYKVYFENKKGGCKPWEDGEVGLSSLKKLNLKNLLKRLQKNWHNFKNLEKVEKLTFIIYFIFSLIWNVLSVVLILFVARLNDTFIECIFILTSFWLSKHTFGKPFHFSSMSKCFIVSNLSYYVLNRLTTPLGISIIVPIMLGVGLSYVTSKLVKKTYKPLYRGMPEELFEETILKVVDKDSTKYKICYDFYIKNKSIISLSIKYNYTEAGIRKIKDRVNEKIKRLN